jgi:IS605 OrfB family transposase
MFRICSLSLPSFKLRFVPSVSTTVQTRIPAHPALDNMGELFGRVERKLHAAFEAERSWTSDLKTGFYQPFGITSQHLDHVHTSLLAKVDAVTGASRVQAEHLLRKAAAKRKQVAEKRKLVAKALAKGAKHAAARDAARAAIAAAKPDLDSIRSTLAARARRRTDAALEKLSKATAGFEEVRLLRKRLKAEIHQHQRRVGNLEDRAATLRARVAKPTLAFGGRGLFAEQNDLAGNGHADHDAWVEAWRDARTGQFFVEGGTHETDGNRFVRLDAQADGTFSLELRLPRALAHLADGGYMSGGSCVHYVLLHGLRFEHGRDQIATWLLAHRLPPSTNREKAGPITYRFVRDDRGWRVMATAGVAYAEPVRSYADGALGVDLNVHHAVVTRADRCGNPCGSWTFPLVAYGKTEGQRLALVRKVCADIVKLAVELKLPLVIEDLDFSKKKDGLACGEHPRRARMLSSFACRAFADALASAALRAGVSLEAVNPAFTSLIGRASHAPRYGSSVHAAAALAIARRAMSMSERAPAPVDGEDGKPVIRLRLDNGDPVTLADPARSRRRHVWSVWRSLSSGLKAVHAARARARKLARSAGARAGGDPGVPAQARRGGAPPPRASGGTIPARSSGSQVVPARDRPRPVRNSETTGASPQVSR